MKKIQVLISLMILAPALMFGQALSKDFTVSLGAPYPVVDAGSKEYFSAGDGIVISVKTSGEKVIIQRYDSKSMKEVGRKEYEDLPKYAKVQEVIKLKDKLYYIFEAINKKEKTFTVYSREISLKDGSFGSIKTLFTTKREVAGSYNIAARGFWGFGAGGNKFDIYTSFDGSMILISWRNVPLEKKDELNFDEIGFYVFNADMEKQWGSEVKMPYTEKQMNNLAWAIGSEGTAFMLAYLNDAKRIELFSVTGAGLEKHRLDLDQKLVFQEFRMQEDVNGNINCAGFYATGVEYKYNFWSGGETLFNTNGIYNFKMDKSGKILAQHNYEFPIALINQYESKRTKDKNDKRESVGKAGIANLKLIYWVNQGDGSTIYIGEQFSIKRVYNPSTKSYTTYYIYGDMVVSKVDADGKLAWMKKLPKTQQGTAGKGGMSVKYISGNGSHYLLFLDNIKNAALKLDQVPAMHQDGRGGFLTAFKLDDATGEVEKHSIFDIKNIKGTEAYQFATSRILDVSEKVFLLEVYIKGKKDTMVKMVLN